MHSTRKQVVATVRVGWVHLHFALWQSCAASKPRVIESYELADATMLGQ